METQWRSCDADRQAGMVNDNISTTVGSLVKQRNFNTSLQRRHNGRDGVSNHNRLDFLLYCLFRRRSKKTSKLRVTGLCEGNPPVTGGFLSQRISNAEIFPSDDLIKTARKIYMVWIPFSALHVNLTPVYQDQTFIVTAGSYSHLKEIILIWASKTLVCF